MNLDHLLESNRQWAEQITAEQPDFFKQLARQQKPDLVWIGCADSRVPANEIMGLMHVFIEEEENSKGKAVARENVIEVTVEN